MVAQVRCSLLIRGLEKDCNKLCEDMQLEKERIEAENSHFSMICSDYYPCDMMLDFSFEELANKFSVDITYLFNEFSDQLCEYDEDYNLDNFLADNNLPECGVAYGFNKETGAVDDLKILRDFLRTF